MQDCCGLCECEKRDLHSGMLALLLVSCGIAVVVFFYMEYADHSTSSNSGPPSGGGVGVCGPRHVDQSSPEIDDAPWFSDEHFRLQLYY